MTEEEKIAENWWDKLTDNQQDWVNNRFYPNEYLDTLEKVVNSYNQLTKEDILTLLSID